MNNAQMSSKPVCVFLTISLLLGISAAQLSTSPTTGAPAASTSMPQGFGLTQAQLRAGVDPSLFLTSYADVSASFSTGGTAKYVQGTNNAALFTLAGNGIASGVVTLDSCSLFTPHSHARANEVIIVTSGNVSIAFVEENAIDVNGQRYGGRVLGYQVPKGSSVTIPQGLVHYIYNNNSCNQAQVITAFDNRDPGTSSIVKQLFQLPDSVVAAATGLDLLAVSLARKVSQDLGLIGIDAECKKRCNGQSTPPPSASMDINLAATSGTGWTSVTTAGAAAPTSTATAG